MGEIKGDKLKSASKFRCPSCGEEYIVHGGYDRFQDKPIKCGNCGTITPKEKWVMKEILEIFH